jgi:hypothetical protein
LRPVTRHDDVAPKRDQNAPNFVHLLPIELKLQRTGRDREATHLAFTGHGRNAVAAGQRHNVRQNIIRAVALKLNDPRRRLGGRRHHGDGPVAAHPFHQLLFLAPLLFLEPLLFLVHLLFLTALLLFLALLVLKPLGFLVPFPKRRNITGRRPAAASRRGGDGCAGA